MTAAKASITMLIPFYIHSVKFATKLNQKSTLFIFAFRFVREFISFSAIEFQWKCLIESTAVKLWFQESLNYKLRMKTILEQQIKQVIASSCEVTSDQNTTTGNLSRF